MDALPQRLFAGELFRRGERGSAVVERGVAARALQARPGGAGYAAAGEDTGVLARVPLSPGRALPRYVEAATPGARSLSTPQESAA